MLYHLVSFAETKSWSCDCLAHTSCTHCVQASWALKVQAQHRWRFSLWTDFRSVRDASKFSWNDQKMTANHI